MKEDKTTITIFIARDTSGSIHTEVYEDIKTWQKTLVELHLTECFGNVEIHEITTKL